MIVIQTEVAKMVEAREICRRSGKLGIAQVQRVLWFAGALIASRDVLHFASNARRTVQGRRDPWRPDKWADLSLVWRGEAPARTNERAKRGFCWRPRYKCGDSRAFLAFLISERKR